MLPAFSSKNEQVDSTSTTVIATAATAVSAVKSTVTTFPNLPDTAILYTVDKHHSNMQYIKFQHNCATSATLTLILK